MRSVNFKSKFANFNPLKFFLLSAIVLSLAIGASAQTAEELSLADLLIGLRSKKLSLPEKNKILTDAVRQRGITFVLGPNIEQELIATGAQPELIAAIKEKSPAPKPAATPAPDFAFYKTRADVNAGKGEWTVALADYNKSVELKPDLPALYVSRAKTYFGLKSFDLAVADFTKAIGLSPNDSSIYLNRGLAYENLNDSKKAVADFQKALELDATNESAKHNLKRLQDEIARVEEASKPKPEAAAPKTMARPEFVNLGSLTGANAVRMVTPVYSPVAQRTQVEGKVMVEVELDEEGNVVEAKATEGHQMLRSSAEDAARRSKFKPALFDNRPIKAKGVIIYNFTLRQRNEE